MHLHTPASRRSLLIFGIVLIMLQPLFSIAHYLWNESIHPYSASGDNIIIPIFGEIAFWILLAPFAITFIVLATRRYQASVALFRKASLSKKFVGINILFGLLICYALLQLYDVVSYLNLPMLIDVLLSLYLIFAVRASVIANWHRSKN